MKPTIVPRAPVALKFLPNLVLVEVIVFVVVGILLGLRPLTDPDIGWHVATGLWMIEHGTVPYPDPFASTGGTWIAYSWLPEVVYAAIFKWRGFFGLQILQLLSILVSMFSLVFLVDSAASRLERAGVVGRPLRLARAVTYVLLIPTLTLVWHLRPQVLSLACFAVFLGWRERGEDRLRFLVPLAILWLNIHIYWVFMLLILAGGLLAGRTPTLRGRAELFTRLMLLGACVLANPYGVEHFYVLFQYAFQHSDAYRLITEFQPIYRQDWLIPVLFCCWLVLALPSMGAAARRSGISELCLFGAFMIAGILQLKYLPIFALFVTPWVVESLARFFTQRFNGSEPEEDSATSGSGDIGMATAEAAAGLSTGQREVPARPLQWLNLGLGLLVFGCLALNYQSEREVLLERQQQILKMTRAIVMEGAPNRRRCVIFSDFNDSGWVILASYLTRTQASSAQIDECRVAIDGRTLVTGGQRMNEYAKLQSSPKDFAEIIRDWQVSDFLLDRESRIAKWGREDLGAAIKGSEGKFEWLALSPVSHR